MNRVTVQPDMFRWARERANIGTEALAKRFPKLTQWERGEVHPTFKQLESFAKATHAPVGFFFLVEPPVERVPIPDFRTVANIHITQPSPELLDTVYLCQQRQDWYHDFAQSMYEPVLDFVSSASLKDDIVETAATMRHIIRFDLDERRRFTTWSDALRHFIGQVDTLGVLIMVSGVVGSNNYRTLDPQEFRGFALVDPLAPLVFINGSDTKAAQMFTLAHELAHLWLGESGVSDAEARTAPSEVVERWCNQVAAELLVPLAELRERLDTHTDLRNVVQKLARHFKVSTLVILRRIYDAGQLTGDEYWAEYDEEVSRLRDLPNDSGGNFYRTLGARVSKRFARALVVSTLEGRVAYTESFRMLGLKKMSTFNELARSLDVGY